MAIRQIRLAGDPILEKISRPVEKITDSIITLLDDMKETMTENNGAGLAAVQVGVLRRVVVVQQEEEGDILELINPEIIALEGVQEDVEGCLSLPGQAGVVARPEKIVVKAQNRNGEWTEIEGKKRLAICLNHELDHLDGILYTDKILYMVDKNDEPIRDE